MKALLTVSRIRSAIAGAKTEQDISAALHRHSIRFSWTTAPGFLAARVPVRSGSVLIIRAASRSAPFSVRFDSGASVSTVSAFPSSPFPVPRFRTFD